MMNVDVSSRKEQRKFGLVMAAAIVVVGSLRWAVQGFTAFPATALWLAGVFTLLALVAPGVLRPVLVVWMRFALALNWVMTRVLFGCTYFLIFVPVRLFFSVVKHDPLKRQWKSESLSYWEDVEEQPAELERYRNQF